MLKNNLFEDFYDSLEPENTVTSDVDVTVDSYQYTITLSLRIDDSLDRTNDELKKELKTIYRKLMYYIGLGLNAFSKYSEPVYFDVDGNVMDIDNCKLADKEVPILYLSFAVDFNIRKPKVLVQMLDTFLVKAITKDNVIYINTVTVHKFKGMDFQDYGTILTPAGGYITSVTENRWVLGKKPDYFRHIAKPLYILTTELMKDKFREVQSFFNDPYKKMIFPGMERCPLLDNKFTFTDFGDKTYIQVSSSYIYNKIHFILDYKTENTLLQTDYVKSKLEDEGTSVSDEEITQLISDIKEWIKNKKYNAYLLYNSHEWPDSVIYMFDEFFRDKYVISVLSYRTKITEDGEMTGTLYDDPRLHDTQKEIIYKTLFGK